MKLLSIALFIVGLILIAVFVWRMWQAYCAACFLAELANPRRRFRAWLHEHHHRHEAHCATRSGGWITGRCNCTDREGEIHQH